MSSWIFGEEGVDKVLSVHSSFVEGRKQRAAQLLKDDFLGSFHPIFSDDKVYSEIDLDLLRNLQSIKGQLNLSKDAQETRYKVYNNLSFLDWFADKTHGVEIDRNILSFEPQAESEVEEALSLMNKACPWMKTIYDQVVFEHCFVKKKDKRRFIGGSSDYRLVGTIFCNLKPKPTHLIDLGVCLAHELGHQVLIIYQTGQDPILPESHDERVYSGVRKTLRPVHGSFHATMALGYMIQFCRGLLSLPTSGPDTKDVAYKYVLEYTKDLKDGLEALVDIEFNQIGNLILKDLITLTKQTV